MKKLFIVLTFIAVTTSLSLAQDIVGDWNGKLTVGTAELRLVLHVSKSADGSLTATLDSVDQNAPGIPVNAVTLKDSKLDLTIDAFHGPYTAKVSADASELDGTGTQGA